MTNFYAYTVISHGLLLVLMVQVLDSNLLPTAQDLLQKLLQQFPNILIF